MLKLNLLPHKLRCAEKSEKGMAILEAIPVLVAVAIIFNFSLGFFGAVHSGILNSIGAYNYTLETFRFRSNLMYFRPGGGLSHYKKSMNRVHGVTMDGADVPDTAGPSSSKSRWPATVRSIAVTAEATNLANIGNPDAIDHSVARSGTSVWRVISSYRPGSAKESPQTPEIWVKTVYGICINAECKATQ